MKKVILSLLFMITLLVVFTACGSTETKTEDTAATDNETKTNKEVATEKTPEGDLSNLEIVSEDYPPTNYLDENGELAGTATELVKKALEKLNLSTKIIKVQDWAKSYDMALKNKNTLIYTINRTPEREKLFKWIAPVSYEKCYMYKLKNNSNFKINTLDDAKKYKIAVVTQDVLEEGLLSRGFESGVNAISFSNQKELVKSVFEGKADGFMFLSGIDDISKFLEGTTFKASDLEVAYNVKELSSVGYIAASLNTSDEIVNKFKEAMPVLEDK